MMGDRAAGRDDGVRGRRLDLGELLELGSPPRRRDHRVVGRRAVGIHVREADGDLALAARCRAHRLGRRAHHLFVERREAVPGDRGLEGLLEDAGGEHGVAQVGRAQERFAPGAGSALAARAARLVPAPAAAAAELERPLQPRPDLVVGRLEAEHEEVGAAVAGQHHPRLAPVDQPAVGGIQPRLGDRAHRVRALLEGREAHRHRRPVDRLGLHAHPCLGDDAERPLRPEQQAVGRGPGARPGQPARRPHAARRDRAHRLDEVVDVRVEGGEMAARPRGDPAAKRRELERLRIVPQGEAVFSELGLEARPGRAGLDARRARGAVDLEQRVEPAQVERHRRPLDARLDAADDARPAAVRDDHGAGVRGPGQHALDVGLVARVGDDVGRMVEAAAEGADEVDVALAVGVARAIVGVGRADHGQGVGRLDARRGQRDLGQRHRLLDVGRAEAEVFDQARRRRADLVGRRTLVLVPPAPVRPSFRGRSKRDIHGSIFVDPSAGRLHGQATVIRPAVP